MSEIIPGIYHIKVPIPNNPLGHTNTYLIKGNDEVLIIDPGMNTDEAFYALKKGLSEIDTPIESITHIVATHPHGDHYGLTGRVKKLSHGRIFLHRLGQGILQMMYSEMENRWEQLEEWLRINGAPRSDPSEVRMLAQRRPGLMSVTMPDILIDDGDTITVGDFNFSVIWTPGHSPGQVCLYEPERKVLFVGDHILPVITPNVSLPPNSDSNPLGDFLNSMNKVRKLDVKIVFPGHERIFNDLPKRVDEIIEHHHHRNTEILEAFKGEPRTAYHLSQNITWMPELGGVSFHDLTPWDKRSALSETLAHLEAMRVAGRITRFHRDSIILYQHE